MELQSVAVVLIESLESGLKLLQLLGSDVGHITSHHLILNEGNLLLTSLLYQLEIKLQIFNAEHSVLTLTLFNTSLVTLLICNLDLVKALVQPGHLLANLLNLLQLLLQVSIQIT
jgi:hypothetical protein